MMNEQDVNIAGLMTETANEATSHIDQMSAMEIAKLINYEDKKVADAVEKELAHIAKAIEEMAKRYRDGGRIIYIGAGTSGRLGVMDAVELIPTYSIPKERAIGLIAGGEKAFLHAVEGAEDQMDLGVSDLKKLQLQKEDIVIGIAASGRTPYVIGALQYANEIGALTIAVACNKEGKMNQLAQIAIAPVTGPEVVSGSTRMKAGTAQKLVLNMLSTGTMILVGRIYQNYMVHVQINNQKLEERARQILVHVLGLSYEKACVLLSNAHQSVACAIVMELGNCAYEIAEQALQYSKGNVREAITSVQRASK